MKRLLLVVDMQKDFIDGSLGTEEARAIVPGVRDKVVKCQSEGWDVAFTLDTHGENYLDTQEAKNFRFPTASRIRTDGSCVKSWGTLKGGILRKIPLEVWIWQSGPPGKAMKKFSWWACVPISVLFPTPFY